MRQCNLLGCFQPVFGTDKNTGIGYCKFHQNKRTDKKPGIKKTYSKTSIKRNSREIRSYRKQNQLVNDIEDKKKEKLEEWFSYVMKLIEKNPYCWNCGKFIPKSFYRAACAHILPKRKTYGFPSVATHLNNFLILGSGCGCHSKFDNSWDDASGMKIWQLAVERYLTIYPEIAAEEHKNIPEQLLKFNS